ncbi:putative transcriptional regulator, TetR family [Gordonia polyisoprenivorans VH2]|uniref:Putative transcriptional regulator, TetR family n=1 Tax=Gordonia polyisoprenivorans (strain DSM 44266 / VH2) TaxID=1112204 RepID=H6MZD2_GORPV|nr:TetR/AcrR family transcriptional regulator [Gordonia polyisoprenivorans]AFA75674.1 putative transcriptional regulator, TetR family [Gordonia polyisoprenivorans VH2]
MRRMTFDERRAELIDAAIRVIARDGLAAATTRAIVGEAGMPQGALFYIFSSREALISAVIEEITSAERLGALLSVELTDPGTGLTDVLTAAMDAYLRLLESDPRREIALLEVATHAMRHDPEAGRRQWEVYRSAVADALRFIADTMSLRWTMPTDELAHIVTSSLDGLTLSWLTDHDSEAARRHIAVLATTFAAMAAPADDAGRTGSEGRQR